MQWPKEGPMSNKVLYHMPALTDINTKVLKINRKKCILRGKESKPSTNDKWPNQIEMVHRTKRS